MTIEEFYKVVGGDYEDIVAKLRGEARVRKYIGKFIESTTFSWSKIYKIKITRMPF